MSSERTNIIGNTDPDAAILNAASTTNNEGDKAFRVVISNQPIQIAFSPAKVGDYGEANSLAGAGTATIIDYTVPVAKRITLNTVFVNGTNRGEYIVEINGTNKSKLNTYYTKFNGEMPDLGISLVAGDNLKVIVNNKGNSSADFNANFSGDIFDA